MISEKQKMMDILYIYGQYDCCQLEDLAYEQLRRKLKRLLLRKEVYDSLYYLFDNHYYLNDEDLNEIEYVLAKECGCDQDCFIQ